MKKTSKIILLIYWKCGWTLLYLIMPHKYMHMRGEIISLHLAI